MPDQDAPQLWQRLPWMRLLGLGLLILLLWQVDLMALGQTIAHTDGRLLTAAVLLNLPMVLFKSLRWQALMAAQTIRYPTRSAYLAYFGSIFIGFLTPAGLGEFVKSIHLHQDCNVSLGQAVSSVLADRVFDLCTLLLVGGAALLSLTAGQTALAALFGALLLVGLPLLLFLNDTTFAPIRRIGRRAGRLGQVLFAPQSWLLELRAGLRQISGWWLVVAILLTGLAYAIFFSQCYLLALSLSLPISFITTSYAVALGSLVTLLPISISGLGTREAAIVTYLSSVGIRPEAGLGFSLLVFVNFYVGGGLIGGVAWWLKPISLDRLRRARVAALQSDRPERP